MSARSVALPVLCDCLPLLFSLHVSSPVEFFRYFRMLPSTFDELLSLLSNSIPTRESNRESISAAERLAITLRFLASGDSQVSISYQYRLGCSTVSIIVTETCAAIWNKLNKIVLGGSTKKFYFI